MRILLNLALFTTLAIAADRPAGMTIHTWVREDMFAGYMVNDLERLEAGIAKLDAILKANPQEPVALAWRGSADVYKASRAFQAGDTDKYRTLLATGMDMMAKARELAPRDGGVMIVSAAPILFADRLAPDDRRTALQEGRKFTLAVIKMQEQMLDQLPLHFRGELWSSVAFASDRLGDTALRDEYLKKSIEKLAGTPYEKRAQKWLETGTLANGTYMCLSCHEPGRYEPTLKRLQARKQ